MKVRKGSSVSFFVKFILQYMAISVVFKTALPS